MHEKTKNINHKPINQYINMRNNNGFLIIEFTATHKVQWARFQLRIQTTRDLKAKTKSLHFIEI